MRRVYRSRNASRNIILRVRYLEDRFTTTSGKAKSFLFGKLGGVTRTEFIPLSQVDQNTEEKYLSVPLWLINKLNLGPFVIQEIPKDDTKK